MEQLEFNLDETLDDSDADEAGWNNWRRSQEEKIQRVRDTWNLPIHRKVRVRLNWRPDELKGLLILREHPRRFHQSEPLRLRVENFDFTSDEIERCVRLRENLPPNEAVGSD